MRRGFIIIAFLFGFNLSLSAQMKTVTIQNSRAVDDTLFNRIMFFLDDFVDGRVVMKDGSIYRAKANIVTIYQYVVIINDKGDTTRVTEEKDIVSLSGGGIFLRKIDGVYYQTLETNGDISLAITKAINFEGEKLTGAYGGSNETSAISKITHIYSEGAHEGSSWGWNREDKAVMRYQYREQLFLISNDKRYLPTQKNFERIFNKQKAEIKKFMTDNNTRLSENSDIIRLFNYLVREE